MRIITAADVGKPGVVGHDKVVGVPSEVLWALNGIVMAARIAAKTGNGRAVVESLAVLDGLENLSRNCGVPIATSMPDAVMFGLSECAYCQSCENLIGWTRSPHRGWCTRCRLDTWSNL